MKRKQDYAAEKARDALDASDGNKHEAALLLRVWAETDDKLFRALATPLMANLTALAIQRATAADQPQATPKKSTGRIPETELLAAIGSKTSQSMSSNRTAPPPPKSSARHKQAVSVLAAAYRKNPTE